MDKEQKKKNIFSIIIILVVVIVVFVLAFNFNKANIKQKNDPTVPTLSVEGYELIFKEEIRTKYDLEDEEIVSEGSLKTVEVYQSDSELVINVSSDALYDRPNQFVVPIDSKISDINVELIWKAHKSSPPVDGNSDEASMVQIIIKNDNAIIFDEHASFVEIALKMFSTLFKDLEVRFA